MEPSPPTGTAVSGGAQYVNGLASDTLVSFGHQFVYGVRPEGKRASTGGVTVLPIYARHVLSSSVVLRPLKAEPPTIDLVMGCNCSNRSC